jgi:O-antigen ligase
VLSELVAPRPSWSPDRLSFPLTYWNALGLFAALGVLLAVHRLLPRGAAMGPGLGAAAVPVMASTLFLTFSRGAILALAVGLIAYAVLLRTRDLVGGLLTVVPPAFVAIVATYNASELATSAGTSPLAIAQGREVAFAALAATLAALLLRAGWDRWVEAPVQRLRLPDRIRKPIRIMAVLAGLVLLVGVPLASGAPSIVSGYYDRFVEGTPLPEDDQRARLLNPGNNGRLDHWRVGVETWQENRLKGTGAGTFQTEWNQRRQSDIDVYDAHSLYVETLSELGVVGFATLMLALLTLAGAMLWRGQRGRRAPGTDPSADAVVVAVFVAWGVHAGLDWIWEMPAVTAWVFALAGFALASRAAPRQAEAAPGRSLRVAIGIGCLVLAVLPFQVSRSQRALGDSERIFSASPRDCPRAIDRALASIEAVGARAEPWEILAYCDIGESQPRLALQAARNAVARDRQNWIYHYGLSLVQGATGEDPRPAARRAQALNPRSKTAGDGAKAFEDAKRRQWPAVARRLPLPLG